MRRLLAILLLVAISTNSALATVCNDKPDDVEYDDDCDTDAGKEQSDATGNGNDLFYAAIKAALTSENYTKHNRYIDQPERVDCIVDDLKSRNAIASVDNSTFEYIESDDESRQLQVAFKDIPVTMEALDRMIQDANFNCRGMATARIIFLVLLVIVTIVCVALCIRSRLLRRVKWSSVEQA